jgi:serine/threonine protein kinase
MIGAGGMGIVYEVLDTQKQAKVALKTLSDFNPSWL